MTSGAGPFWGPLLMLSGRDGDHRASSTWLRLVHNGGVVPLLRLPHHVRQLVTH